jgi:hypothetical protein
MKTDQPVPRRRYSWAFIVSINLLELLAEDGIDEFMDMHQL